MAQTSNSNHEPVKTAPVETRDVRNTQLWREIEEHWNKLHSPAFGKPSAASEPSVSPDGTQLVFTGGTWEKVDGVQNTSLYLVSVKTGDMTAVTGASYNDKCPQWSPDGTKLAFLSDRAEAGCFQLYLLETGGLGEAQRLGSLDGTAEYIRWSPTGKEILVGIAGRGAHMGGAQGSGKLDLKHEGAVPDWMPTVEADATGDAFRTLWVYDTVESVMRRISRPGLNVWESTWYGPDQVAAVVTEAPGEEAWYEAVLALIPVTALTKPSRERVVFRSKRQLGLVAASPSGSRLAVVQAVCSDRGIIAGDALLININDGSATTLDTGGVDVTQLAWRDEDRLFYIGLRGLRTVAGDIYTASNKAHELFETKETCGGRYPEASILADDRFLVIYESWTRYPEVGIVANGKYQTVASLDHEGGVWLRSKLGPVEEVKWKAPDGLEIEGLLTVPKSGQKPYPLVLNVHGGPIWSWRNKWHMAMPNISLLVSRGYAVLSPNPRGSSGRGQEFAERVFGDMGGLDTLDYLSGIDSLVNSGVADPARLGVTGGSYGGYISTWLVTQTNRFAASVAVAPVTDWYSQHTTSNIPTFDALGLDGKPYAADGLYYQRSPVMFAGRCKTPVLQISGLEDLCTPPTQAVQFHRALVEHGIKSVLALYPGEGHGIRKFPAYIDYCYRLLKWFEEYMPVVS